MRLRKLKRRKTLVYDHFGVNLEAISHLQTHFFSHMIKINEGILFLQQTVDECASGYLATISWHAICTREKMMGCKKCKRSRSIEEEASNYWQCIVSETQSANAITSLFFTTVQPGVQASTLIFFTIKLRTVSRPIFPLYFERHPF